MSHFSTRDDLAQEFLQQFAFNIVIDVPLIRPRATAPFDSCPLGVSADSCPAGAP